MSYDLSELITLCCDVLQRDEELGCFDFFAGLLGSYHSL